MELNISIIDDTLSDVFRLKSFIESWFAASEHKLTGITTFTSGEEILKAFEPKMFQIVFMDIIMKEINGVETAKILRDYDPELLIVFTTTSREYAFDAFPVHPFDYVLKPYSKKDVGKVLDEALRFFTAADPAMQAMNYSPLPRIIKYMKIWDETRTLRHGFLRRPFRKSCRQLQSSPVNCHWNFLKRINVPQW